MAHIAPEVTKQLHEIWLNNALTEMCDIEAAFNGVLSAHGIAELSEEFYEDVNCEKSDRYEYFDKIVTKHTTPVEDDFCDGEIPDYYGGSNL